MARLLRDRTLAAGIALRDPDGTAIGLLAVAWEHSAQIGADIQALTSIFASRSSAELMRLRRDWKIQRLQDTLEQRVQARTAQLQHINRELDLGIPEPAETYSSSAHLFEDLGIPSGTKGRIAKSTRSDDRPAQSLESKGAGDRNRAQRDRSDRGDSRGRARQKQGDRGPERRTGSSSGATNDESASKGETHGGHEHKRPSINRQRTRGGKN